MWRFLKRLILILILVSAAVGKPAFACFAPAEFEISDVKAADAVLVGRILEYEPKEGYASLKIEVHRQLTGNRYIEDEILNNWEVINVSWQNSTFQLPEWLENDSRIIALRETGGNNLPLRGPSGVVFGDPEGYDYTLLQAPCSRPFNLPLSEVTLRDISYILNGENPPLYPLLTINYHDPASSLFYRVLELETLIKALCVIFIVLLFLIVFTFCTILRRKLSKPHTP